MCCNLFYAMSARTSANAFRSSTMKWHWSDSHLIETCFSLLDTREYSPKHGLIPVSLSGAILFISLRKIPFLHVYFSMLNSIVISYGSIAVLRTSILNAQSIFFSSSFKSHSREVNQLGFFIIFLLTLINVLLVAYESLPQTNSVDGKW